MDRNRRNFLNKHSSPQFKKRGDPRKGKESSDDSDTVYRILCLSKNIGSVIGRGGNIVRALREETQAKITVSESVPGSDDRVIIVFSPSNKRAKQRSSNNGDKPEKRDDAIEPHCAAQDALLRVHNRIVEEDIGGVEDNNKDGPVVTARLLVSNNTVGCLLGRKGDVIQRLRSETGANIRVLPADHLPAFASSNDVLVQVTSKPATVRKALYEISTLLHQNPRKDKPPSNSGTSYAGQRLHPPGLPERNMLPERDPVLLDHTTDVHSIPSRPWQGGYGSPHPRSGRDDIDGVLPLRDREAPIEFTMKILCSAGKIGGVIGKGGVNVKQLEQDTGASIHVENVSAESDERVIHVSSLEVLSDQVSQTITAILQLQSKTSEYSEKGTITTRLLAPSSKVGCILGQGGNVINEMRRRTHADIRVVSKEGKPKCASEDEELVQISGSFGVAKDALVEIASRLRMRCLRDENSGGEPVPVRSVPQFGHTGNLYRSGIPTSSPIVTRSSGRYEHLKGELPEYESPGFPFRPRNIGYLDVDDAISSPLSRGGSCIFEFAGKRVDFEDRYSTRSEFRDSERLNAMPNLYETPSSYAGPDNHHRPVLYQSYHSRHGAYPDGNASPVPYRNSKPEPVSYHNIDTQQGSYQNISTYGSYRY